MALDRGIAFPVALSMPCSTGFARDGFSATSLFLSILSLFFSVRRFRFSSASLFFALLAVLRPTHFQIFLAAARFASSPNSSSLRIRSL